MINKDELTTLLVKRKNMVHRAEKLSHYSDHPMNMFDFMRDWWLITDGLRGVNIGKNQTGSLFKPITDKDYKNAKEALMRLQIVYKLDIGDMIKGVINGHKGKPMDGDDILDIVEAAITNRYYEAALDWLKHAEVEEGTTYALSYKFMSYVGKQQYDVAKKLLKKLEKVNKDESAVKRLEDMLLSSMNSTSQRKQDYTQRVFLGMALVFGQKYFHCIFINFGCFTLLHTVLHSYRPIFVKQQKIGL